MRKLIIALAIILMFSFSLNKYNPIKEESQTKEKKALSRKNCVRIPCRCCKAPCICPCVPIIKPSKSTKIN